MCGDSRCNRLQRLRQHLSGQHRRSPSFCFAIQRNRRGPDLTITLTPATFNNFVVQTTVMWDQKSLKTCVVTTTAANVCAPANDTGNVVSVTAVVPAALTAKAGT